MLILMAALEKVEEKVRPRWLTLLGSMGMILVREDQAEDQVDLKNSHRSHRVAARQRQSSLCSSS